MIAKTNIGGGAPQGEGWQPHPDWWDIKAILDADTTPGYAGKYIVLVGDYYPTFKLANFAAYRTSDGAFYTTATTHTWDASKDKPCSDGYKTRYVIYYSTNANIAITQPTSHSAMAVLWIYVGSGNVSSITAVSYWLEAFECAGSVTSSGTSFGSNAFGSNCRNLTKVQFPEGATGLGSAVFGGAPSLREFEIPASVTSLGAGALSSGMPIVYLPNSITTTTMTDPLISASTRAVVVEQGFDSRLCLEQANGRLSISSLVALFENLKDNTGGTAKIIDLGTDYLGRLTAEQKAIATNKNWTLT